MGVVEDPINFVRDDVFKDLVKLIGETIAEQDAVLLGRRMYEEWSGYWPDSKIEPFATFINSTPKFVASKTLTETTWRNFSLLSGDLDEAIKALKAQNGKTIGVHGSISLTQSLLVAGLLDELRFISFPAMVGKGRRLFDRDVAPIQFDMLSARATPSGLQYLIYTPRK